MKNFKILFSLLLFVLPVLFVQAQQGETILNLRYSAAMPIGSFKNNVSSTSFRGFGANILYGLSDKISIGFGTGFQDFYQKKDRQLYKFSDGSDISAVVSYSIQTIPVLAVAKYSFSPGAAIQPYAAFGLGGNMISYNKLFGQFSSQLSKFGFAARPEAGLYIPFAKGGETGFTLSASYNLMPFRQAEFKNLNSVGMQAGINIPLRR